MKRFVIVGVLVVLLASLVPSTLLGYGLYDVFLGSYENFKKEKIIEILSKETTLYYADGQTQLGSLFGNEHRQYVTLKDIPKDVLDAVVAAEDDTFYRHPGVDLVSTMRAAFKTIFLRKREGASTITQQTVKNLFGRPVTNLKAKYTEAINAFKLERSFTKEEILEFYLNQFHVTGNGRGVGVAAKYYFDKDVSELTLAESAFIAGSVKGPERYNPFTKRNLQAQQKARAEAKKRKNYVLRRMFENTFISQEEFDKAREEEVPFKQGRFQFNELAVTELVQRQVARKEVLQAIGAETADEVGTMGLRITTTLEKPVQLAAQYGVRQNLSRLEMILTGFQKESERAFINIQMPEKYAFHVGRVVKIDRTAKAEKMTLSFGVPECSVPTDAIDRVAKITDQALYRGFAKSKQAFLASIAENDHLLASVREVREDGTLVCDLERRPRIQGALIVLDRGQVVAMVGGYNPHEYNRAVFARRQPGSTFKTLTYYPALQLGWHALEPLLNVRNVYTWQGQFYYPRPDHAPESLETTFPGAGAKSENLASVWLMAHMLDRLTFSQFRDLLVDLEIYREGEPENEFMARIGREFNARLLDDNLKGGIFEAVKIDLVQDVSISRERLLRTVIKTMNYGKGFEGEIARMASGRGGKIPAKERALRLHVLRNNLQRWTDVAENGRAAIARLKASLEAGGTVRPEDRALLGSLRLVGDGTALAYVSPDAYQPQIVSPLFEAVNMRVASPEEILAAVGRDPNLASEEALLLDGVLPLGLVREIQTQISNRFAQVQNGAPIEKLFWHDDFRYSVGMVYAQQMVKGMGVESELQWVPSFPLGANVVTLAELALSYQSLLKGETHRYFEQGADNQIVLIKRIEDAQGNLLWEGEPRTRQLIDPFYSPSILSVLRGTVTSGTARAAHKNVILRSNDRQTDKILEKAGVRIPLFGKTGTTNDHVNATYVGFLPYPADQGARELSADNVYTIASYVGYDSNEPMRKRGFRVAGGTGALPAWIETALALVREEKFADKLNWQSLVENKVQEVPFDYGDANPMSVPVHSPMVAAAADVDADSDDDKADLNARIDDYGASKSGLLRIALPGRVSDGVFVPRVRVSFFQKPTPEERAAAAGAVNGRTSELPAAPDVLAEKGNAQGAHASGQNVPSAALTPTPFGPAKLPEDNFEGEDPADFDLEVPPAPPGLDAAPSQGNNAAP